MCVEFLSPGQLILRWERLMKVDTTLTKASVLVAAWKRGGYCLMRRSVVAQSPYFGCFDPAPCVVGEWSCGGYIKSFSSPVHGSMRGGSRVSFVQGTTNVRLLTRYPIRSSAASFAGREKVLDRKFTVRSSKTVGARRLQKS